MENPNHSFEDFSTIEELLKDVKIPPMFKIKQHFNNEQIDDVAAEVQKMLAENGVELKLTEGALDFLSQVGYDPEFGARPVKRAIQRYLLNDLSKKLLSQEVDRSKAITVDAGGDGLVFRN